MRSIKWAVAVVLVSTTVSMAADLHGLKGTLKSATGNELIVTDDQGKDMTFRVADTAAVVCADKKDARANDLKAGTQVTVLYDKKGDGMQAVAILHNDGAFRDAMISHGKVKTAADANGKIVVSDSNGKDWTFTTDDQARVRLNNQPAKIGDLKQGEDVIYVFEKKGDTFRLLSVCECPTKP